MRGSWLDIGYEVHPLNSIVRLAARDLRGSSAEST